MIQKLAEPSEEANSSSLPPGARSAPQRRKVSNLIKSDLFLKTQHKHRRSSTSWRQELLEMKRQMECGVFRELQGKPELYVLEEPGEARTVCSLGSFFSPPNRPRTRKVGEDLLESQL